MRIACLYLPSLPLQAFLRGAPQWIGAPVAIVDAGRVVACSRAAWAAGLRPGASGAAAHESVPGLIAVAAPPTRAADKATIRALADALLAVSDAVDIGGEPVGAHHAIYLAVPPRTRGATFGARLLEICEAQGLRARVGIADDRFTAWVAASWYAVVHGAGAVRGGAGSPEHDHEVEPVVTVPRGGSAAFLAPLPLSLLAIPAEVQHVLATLGVRTLGEFAALPPPSTAHGWDADYQALARGDGGAGLVRYVPQGANVDPVVERVAVGGDVGVGAALGIVARRVAGRLVGRGRAAMTLQVRTEEGSGLPLPLPLPTADERDLADLAAHVLPEGAAMVEIEVVADVSAEVAGAAAARMAESPLFAVAAMAAVAPGGAGPVVPPASPAAESGVVAAAVVAEGSAPVFRLTPPDTVALAPREPHRRTRRGKQRTRAAVAAQSRLFGLGLVR